MTMSSHARFVAGMFLCIASAGAAGAATLSESSAGDFSSIFSRPTEIAAGADTVEGVWSGHRDADIIFFSGLQAGAQSLTFSFFPSAPIGEKQFDFSAGGRINWKTEPLQHDWDGKMLADVAIMHWNRAQTFEYTLNLDEGFTGQLWLGLYNTFGALDYRISAPGNAVLSMSDVVMDRTAQPTVVPLPGAGALMLLALGGLGVTVATRNRRVNAGA